MCPTGVAQQQTVALGVIAGIGSFRSNFYQPTVTVLAFTGRYTFGNNNAAGVFAQMNHFGSRIGLLMIVGNGNRVKFSHRIIPRQNTGRVLPGYGRARFNLSPGNLSRFTLTQTTLSNKVINTTLALFIARIPVLYSRIFDFCPVVDDNLYYSHMQLVFVAYRSRTAFQVADIAIVLGHYQCALKLACIDGIDSEIG